MSEYAREKCPNGFFSFSPAKPTNTRISVQGNIFKTYLLHVWFIAVALPGQPSRGGSDGLRYRSSSIGFHAVNAAQLKAFYTRARPRRNRIFDINIVIVSIWTTVYTHNNKSDSNRRRGNVDDGTRNQARRRFALLFYFFLHLALCTFVIFFFFFSHAGHTQHYDRAKQTDFDCDVFPNRVGWIWFLFFFSFSNRIRLLKGIFKDFTAPQQRSRGTKIPDRHFSRSRPEIVS